jgi:ribosome-binding factor A
MPNEFGRELRVGSRLQRILNELLQSQVKDPRLADVRVSAVEVSGDLGVAKVYFAMLDPGDDPSSAEAAFGSAGGFLRSRAAGALGLRRAPELRFIHDRSAERGLELSGLIDELSPSEYNQEEE